MKKVFSADNNIIAGHIHSLLETYGIAGHVRNMFLSGGIGELPINECWPEVWIYNASDYEIAERLIATALSKAQKQADWQCQCGEIIEGQFAACWCCGSVSKR